MQSVGIFFLDDDGIVRRNSLDNQICYRHCATDHRGNPKSLLAEMRGSEKPVPWQNREARDAAVEVVQELERLPARTRQALLNHIGKTPYAKFERIIHITLCDGKPKFAHYRAARCPPAAWGQFLDDLRQECKEGRPPIPYASKKLRGEQANHIMGNFGELLLSPQEKTSLLAHVAKSPYLSS